MIAIIDYGVGNLRSVEKAFEFLGHRAKIVNDKESIKKADKVVLPGVGAFADAMKSLKETGIMDTVYEVINEGKPFLGICLGMQLLFDYSEEGDMPKGLGILKGAIRLIPVDKNLKVPQIGWNSLNIVKESKLFTGIPTNSFVYFVHSYYLQAGNREDVIATTHYGIDIDVAVNRDNIYAVQFHPEKSGEVGLKILDNFARLT